LFHFSSTKNTKEPKIIGFEKLFGFKEFIVDKAEKGGGLHVC